MSDGKDLVPIGFGLSKAASTALPLGLANLLFSIRQNHERNLANASWHVDADDLRAALDMRLIPGLNQLDPVPHATIEQAKRRARVRTDLLAAGAFTHESLADGRGQTVAAARQWVHRGRQRGALFSVKHDGETLVPAFLLDADLNPRPEYAGAIKALTAVGSDGWGLWAWFAQPSSWLGGKVPAQHALDDSDAVTYAAERRASNAA